MNQPNKMLDDASWVAARIALLQKPVGDAWWDGACHYGGGMPSDAGGREYAQSFLSSQIFKARMRRFGLKVVNLLRRTPGKDIIRHDMYIVQLKEWRDRFGRATPSLGIELEDGKVNYTQNVGLGKNLP